MPYAGGENPKMSDTVKHPSRGAGTVFELDLQADKTAKEQGLESEEMKVKFDDGSSTVDLAKEFRLVKRTSE
jgi:hypothetical protein